MNPPKVKLLAGGLAFSLFSGWISIEPTKSETFSGGRFSFLVAGFPLNPLKVKLLAGGLAF